ncbi:hypothetical protein CRG98_028035 [Punica granatum]|uniref:Uncharacterized protein n=1 Tax=Punica granatum TaxID=22663 RepID=A0A2I0J688_PUNGR|nr:hypothetical protein CRG98_028035 [Punica granatum]
MESTITNNSKSRLPNGGGGRPRLEDSHGTLGHVPKKVTEHFLGSSPGRKGIASMYEEKSRGSGLESRETRLGATGGMTRERCSRGSLGKTGRHACSSHGTVEEGEELEPPAKGISRGLGRSNRSHGFEPRLGVEPWLNGLAWLSCGSHSVKRKAGKSFRLD